jgi:hypothetical protein
VDGDEDEQRFFSPKTYVFFLGQTSNVFVSLLYGFGWTNPRTIGTKRGKKTCLNALENKTGTFSRGNIWDEARHVTRGAWVNMTG